MAGGKVLPGWIPYMHLAETVAGCGLHLTFGCSSQLQIRGSGFRVTHSLEPLRVLWSWCGYMRCSGKCGSRTMWPDPSEPSTTIKYHHREPFNEAWHIILTEWRTIWDHWGDDGKGTPRSKRPELGSSAMTLCHESFPPKRWMPFLNPILGMLYFCILLFRTPVKRLLSYSCVLDKPARLTIRVNWFLFLTICQSRSWKANRETVTLSTVYP